MNGITGDTSFHMDEWLVEPKLNRLSRNGRAETVEPRVMNLLVYLASRGSDVSSTEQILASVWSNVVVSEQSVYQSIAQLRKILRDNAVRPRYIKTIPKKGYQLVAMVQVIGGASVEPDTRRAACVATQVELHAAPQPVSKSIRPSARASVLPLVAVSLLLVCVLLGLLIARYHDSNWQAQDARVRPKSVAVLPMAALGGGWYEELFAAGVSEELLNVLARAPGIRVVARTSSFAMQGESDVREIGRRLGVESVVEGSVRIADGRARVTARLIDTRDAFELWSVEDERELKNIFAAQDAVAAGILNALWFDGKADVASLLGRPPTVDVNAYEFYLLGTQYLEKRTSEALQRAQVMFEKALALDPDYGLAYVGAAQASLLLSRYGDLDLNEAIHGAELAVDRAMSLDSLRAEVFGTRGLLRIIQERWQEAERALQSAVNESPGYAPGWMWLGHVVAVQGRLVEAQAYSQKARILDPLNIVNIHNDAYHLYMLGEQERSLQLLREASGLLPDETVVLLATAKFGELSRLLGQYDTAAYFLEQRVAATQSLTKGSEDAVYVRTSLAYVYRETGKADRAKALLEDAKALLRRARGAGFDSAAIDFDEARIASEQGDIDLALTHLQRAIERGYPNYFWIERDTVLQPVRSSAGYRNIEARMAERRRDAAHLVKTQLGTKG